MTNGAPAARLFRHSGFVIRHSFVILVSDFGFPPSLLCLRRRLLGHVETDALFGALGVKPAVGDDRHRPGLLFLVVVGLGLDREQRDLGGGLCGGDAG